MGPSTSPQRYDASSRKTGSFPIKRGWYPFDDWDDDSTIQRYYAQRNLISAYLFGAILSTSGLTMERDARKISSFGKSSYLSIFPMDTLKY
ncbi:hypothetical protein BDW59DRAFT_77325 [Aspergillus cavernicola]|uniref:Uncharacterized protein n=1 Tax=Aspergillus cavernicola TaxID=176166 RepID=A0ABR4J009_9EURO